MKTLQQFIDDYGASTECINWEGWVRECMQHPDMVVNKFNEITEEFRKQSVTQITEATTDLKMLCYNKKNWCANQAHYMTLLGDNKSINEWFENSSVKNNG